MEKRFQILLLLALALIDLQKVVAQVTPPGVISDSIKVTVQDSVATADSLALNRKRDIETTIKYSATDSIRLDVVKRIAYLYGDAVINYGDIDLTASKVEIDWGTNTLTAYAGTDSSGKKIGIPVFKQGADQYTSEIIRYNFKTKKGIISSLITQQGEGYIHGETVKRDEEQLFVQHAQYTTCNLAHPHFYINAPKLKLIPNDKIVSGPFNLVIADIPTPLGFLLGLFPVPKKNKSGLIFPAYGESQVLGFYLNRLGWYFAVNDYIGVKLTTDIYSRGSYGAYLETSYRKRYQYQGNFSFNYFTQRNNAEVSDIPNSSYRVTWIHGTNSTGRSSNFNASVNISSGSYYRQNSLNPSTRLANDFNSSVNYSKTFTGTPFLLNVKLNQSQNVSSKLTNVTFPDVFFSMNRVFPFKKKGSLGKAWYEQIAVNYNFNSSLSMTNAYQRFDNRRSGFVPVDSGLAIQDPSYIPYFFQGGEYYRHRDSLRLDPTPVSNRIFLNGAQYGAKHTLPITTSFKIFKKFSFNPAVNCSEWWYPTRQVFYYDVINNRDTLLSRTEHGFSRAFGWSTGGTNLSTNVYGTFNFGKGKLMAVRHTLIPSIGYTYSPDLTSPVYGAHQTIRNRDGFLVRDKEGKPVRLNNYAKYSRLYSSPVGTESSSLSFSLRNSLEAKVRTPKDTANPTKKFKLLDELSLTSAYNFLADSFKLQPISLTARNNFANGKVDVAFFSTFDPYDYVLTGDTTRDLYNRRRTTRINRYSFRKGGNGPLANLISGGLSITTSLRPKARTADTKPKTDQEVQQLRYIRNNPELYVDFNIPWNLSLSYQLNFNGKNNLYGLKNAIISNSITVSGDVSLTEKLKITGFTSYDFINKSNPPITLGIVRDLHCWQMSVNVTSYNGQYNYLFNIQASASLLQDLKLTKRSPGLLNSMSF